jgi:hypothetical protein
LQRLELFCDHGVAILGGYFNAGYTDSAAFLDATEFVE